MSETDSNAALDLLLSKLPAAYKPRKNNANGAIYSRKDIIQLVLIQFGGPYTKDNNNSK
jgi:hypothetical protein